MFNDLSPLFTHREEHEEGKFTPVFLVLLLSNKSETRKLLCVIMILSCTKGVIFSRVVFSSSTGILLRLYHSQNVRKLAYNRRNTTLTGARPV